MGHRLQVTSLTKYPNSCCFLEEKIPDLRVFFRIHPLHASKIVFQLFKCSGFLLVIRDNLDRHGAAIKLSHSYFHKGMKEDTDWLQFDLVIDYYFPFPSRNSHWVIEGWLKRNDHLYQNDYNVNFIGERLLQNEIKRFKKRSKYYMEFYNKTAVTTFNSNNNNSKNNNNNNNKRKHTLLDPDINIVRMIANEYSRCIRRKQAPQ